MSQYSQGLTNAQLNQQLLAQLQGTNALSKAQAQMAAAQAQMVAQNMFAAQTVPMPSVFANRARQIEVHAPEPLPISTQFGEIVGYRFWNYFRGFLRSASHRYIWMPGKTASLMEGQKIEDHGSAGIYAFKSQADMLLEAYEGDLVFGTVKLWGDVIEYERGYHAEFASIVSLDHADMPSMRKHQNATLSDLRARYLAKEETK